MTKGTLAERTAESLVAFFKEQGMTVGDRLPNEYTLAKSLDVGRSTLREAVRMLATKNILEVKQGSGTYIKNLTPEAENILNFTENQDPLKITRDLFEVRFLLEPQMASLAALNIEDEEMKHLESLMLAIEEEYNHPQKEDLHRSLDVQFHSVIAESSRNIAMSQIVPIIIQSIELYNKHFASDEIKRKTIETHRAIVEAIKNHQPQEAYDAMLLHLASNRSTLKQKNYK